jgi:hypothetical protein
MLWLPMYVAVCCHSQGAVLLLAAAAAAACLAAGAPKPLYGFEPSELIGRPLAAAVDVFGQWIHQFGDDETLLALLAQQCIDGAACGNDQAAGSSWRVGVHLPVKSDADIEQHAAAMAQGGKHGKVRQHCCSLHSCFCYTARTWRFATETCWNANRA